MKAAIRILWLGVALLCVPSCSDPKERNVIIGGTIFLTKHFAYEAQDADKIILAAQRFATRSDMDFLLARRSLHPGDFNATAASSDLNLKVMHSEAIDGPGIATISAIARKRSSASDARMARQFACFVGALC